MLALLAQLRVPHIGKMGDFRPPSHHRVLHFYEGTRLGALVELSTGSQRGVGTDLDVVADPRTSNHRIPDSGSFTDPAVSYVGVGTDLGTGSHRGSPLEVDTGMEPDPCLERDGSIDVHPGRILHPYPASHPGVVDPGAHQGGCSSQLVLGVDPR